MTFLQAVEPLASSHLTDTDNPALKQDSEPRAEQRDEKSIFCGDFGTCKVWWRGLEPIASCRITGTEAANKAATLLRLTETTQTHPLYLTPSNIILLQARISEHSLGSPQNYGAQQTSR